MNRSDFLTGGTLLHGSVADDYADLIAEPDDERIVEGLKSAYTKALFNAVISVKHAGKPELMLDLLMSVNRNASRLDDWKVIEDARIDLPTTLELIQMELLESAAFCGPNAMPLLTSALATSNDVLHFGVLNGIKASGHSMFIPMLRSYRDELDNRAIHADSKDHLSQACNEALDSCLPFQVW